MGLRNSLKIISISALRVGFCTALATSVSLGTVALLSCYSPETERELGEVLKNMNLLGAIFNWGAIPSALGFLLTGILELAFYCKLRSPARAPLEHYQRLNQILSHHKRINKLEIHLTSICAIVNSSLNLYALGGKELEYGVSVPLASIVGMIFSSHGVPSKTARFLVNTGHSFIKNICHSCSRAKIPTQVPIQVPIQQAQVMMNPAYQTAEAPMGIEMF